MQTYYDVFHRTWWDEARQPCPGKRHYIQRRVTLDDARELCREYNSTHEPGPMSDKAEFEESD